MRTALQRKAGTALASLTLMVVAACGNSTSAVSGDEVIGDGEPLTIGISTVATGPLAINNQVSEGLEAYVSYKNAKGGFAGHEIKLEIVDSQGTVAGGSTSTRQLLASGPFGIFVLSTAPFSGSQAALQNSPEVPVFVLANGSVVEASKLPNAFGMFTDYTTESLVGLETFAAQGRKRIAFVYDPTIGEDAAKKLPAEAEKLGAEIIEIPLPATTSNYAPAVQRLRSSGADAIVFQVVAQSISGTMRAAQKAGLDLPAMSYSGQLNATTLDLGGDALEGMYFSALFPLVTDPSPAVKEFAREIEEIAPEAATVLGILGWNTGAMIERAIEDASERGDLTRASFMEALRELGGERVGVVENVGWTDETVSSIDAGNTEVFTLYQVQNGEFVKVER